MPNVPCFWLEPTPFYEVYARRYTSNSPVPCTKGSFHQAWVLQAVVQPNPGFSSGPPTDHEKGVFLWPEHCRDCSYTFGEEDNWQRFFEHQYVRQDTGEQQGLRAFPPGAMYRVTWFEDFWKGPDGMCLAVRLPIPDHPQWDWIIDGPATGGGHWERTGVPPLITVSPSIAAGTAPDYLYHGFLREGVLVD